MYTKEFVMFYDLGSTFNYQGCIGYGLWRYYHSTWSYILKRLQVVKIKYNNNK